jgi:hypothetical protein
MINYRLKTAIIRGFPRFPFATPAIILAKVLFVKFFENDFLATLHKVFANF